MSCFCSPESLLFLLQFPPPISANVLFFVEAPQSWPCMSALIRLMVLTSRIEQYNSAPNRRRANSTVTQNTPMSPPLQKHHRATSEVSIPLSRPAHRSRYKPDMLPPLSNRSKSHQHMSGPHPARLPDSMLADDMQGDDVEMTLRSPNSSFSSLASMAGDLFDDLVARLLAPPRNRQDAQFTSIFLALYRMFASPGQLLDTILKSFDGMTALGLPPLHKAGSQHRHLNVLDAWLSHYPGDFAHPSTFDRMNDFVTQIAVIPMFTASALELANHLKWVTHDDDTEWAVSDHDEQRASLSRNGLKELTRKLSGLALSSDHSAPQTPISPVASGTSTPWNAQSMTHFVEQASRQAQYLVPSGQHALTKLHWHLLIDIGDDIIAREMTRMDWTMFCSIRPRDLVRHVTLPESQKAQYKSLENVQRMIDHFNHVAIWTVNMILLRDKPKHRAIMMEKMMRVARELRIMNNYNSLGAVIAGITNVAVTNLNTTREMIDPAVGKDFMKLNILMSSQKSYSAYRLAWENTSCERIPYIPLHRRDLVTAASGNRTFIGGDSDQGPIAGRRINWKKIEIMGSVVVSMERAKEITYPLLTRNDHVKSLLIDLAIERDEEVKKIIHFALTTCADWIQNLYQRSKHLEPGINDAKGGLFSWPRKA